jgi:hypothetical protein
MKSKRQQSGTARLDSPATVREPRTATPAGPEQQEDTDTPENRYLVGWQSGMETLVASTCHLATTYPGVTLTIDNAGSAQEGRDKQFQSSACHRNRLPKLQQHLKRVEIKGAVELGRCADELEPVPSPRMVGGKTAFNTRTTKAGIQRSHLLF